MEAMERVAPLAASAFCVFLGLWILVSTWRAYITNQQSLRWPTVAGVITISQEAQRPGNVSDQMKHEAQRASSEQEYATDTVAQIVYKYTIAGKEYTGWALGSFVAMNVTQALLEKYPKGKAVKVSYNPNNPQQCVVDPIGAANLMSVLLGSIIGMVFLVLATVPAVYVFAPTMFDGWLKMAQGVLGYKAK